MIGLAEQARRSVGEARGGPGLLRVAATSTVAEHVAVPLLDAFTDRTPNLEAAVEVEPAPRFADLLEHRRADIALGPRPSPDSASSVVAVPFLRCRLVLVAGPHHRLAGRHDIAPRALATERWLVGPGGADSSSPTGQYFERQRIAPDDVRAFPSDAAALAAVSAGEGVMLALVHAVVDDVRRRAVARLDVRGTPFADLWYATTLGPERSLPGALALQRFATTPQATQAVTTRQHGVPASRVRPFMHVTLWSGVARAASPARTTL
jgi:DNA-binding transcriptional LysR family regulator